MSKINLPNIITSLRILFVPLIIYFLIKENLFNLILALIIFFISALTDTFDGLVARKLKQSSDFGASFDPLADKILIWSVFTVFIFKKELNIPFYLVIFIYLRDFLITFIRSYSKKKNLYFSTSFIAKAKTGFQMISIVLILLYMIITNIFIDLYRNKLISLTYKDLWKHIFGENYIFIIYIPLLLTIITVILTIYSAVDYVIIFIKEIRKNEK